MNPVAERSSPRAPASALRFVRFRAWPRRFVWGACLAGLAGVAGCRTPEADSPGERPESYHIAVRRSDPANRFVVLECLPALPAGTEIDVYRGSDPVGRVVMTGSRRGGYGIAAWLTGEPAAGDWGKPVVKPEKGTVP